MTPRPKRIEPPAAAEKLYAVSKISTVGDPVAARGTPRPTPSGGPARVPRVRVDASRRGARPRELRTIDPVAPELPAGAEPCVWMCAGLISYRLCTEEFDCDHCLLDVALRGECWAPPPVGAFEHRGLQGALREDRLYTQGHVWVQKLAPAGSLRVGIDAFAAAIIGSVVAVRWQPPGVPLEPGDPICDLDLAPGLLSLGAPLRGAITYANEALYRHPGLLLTSPYDDGWLVEFDAGDATAADSLLPARAALDRVAADLRRFRRAAALRLLTGRDGDIAGAASGARHLTDLTQLLDGSDYLELVGSFIH